MPRGFANVGTSPFFNHFPTLRAGKSAIIPSQKKRSSSTMFQSSTIILFILFIVISFFMGVEYSKKKNCLHRLQMRHQPIYQPPFQPVVGATNVQQ